MKNKTYSDLHPDSKLPEYNPDIPYPINEQFKPNKQVCLCGHSIDEHVGNGQLEECMHPDCHCVSYEEDNSPNKSEGVLHTLVEPVQTGSDNIVTRMSNGKPVSLGLNSPQLSRKSIHPEVGEKGLKQGALTNGETESSPALIEHSPADNIVTRTSNGKPISLGLNPTSQNKTSSAPEDKAKVEASFNHGGKYADKQQIPTGKREQDLRHRSPSAEDNNQLCVCGHKLGEHGDKSGACQRYYCNCALYCPQKIKVTPSSATESGNISGLADTGYTSAKDTKTADNILNKYSKLRLYRSKSCQLLLKQLKKELEELQSPQKVELKEVIISLTKEVYAYSPDILKFELRKIEEAFK